MTFNGKKLSNEKPLFICSLFKALVLEEENQKHPSLFDLLNGPLKKEDD